MTARCPLDDIARDISDIGRRTFQKPGADGSIPRRFHKKTHACLRGSFHVEPPQDEALRAGLFATAATHPAIARFSSSFVTDDAQPDVRGLALKIAGVDGPVCEGAVPGQQDFILVNQAFAPFIDAPDALEMMRNLDGIPAPTPRHLFAVRYALGNFNPARIRWYYLRNLLDVVWQDLRSHGLDHAEYNSITPFRLGAHAVRWLCRPQAAPAVRAPRRADFTQRLQARLDRGPLRFDFLAQLPQAGTDDPENAARPWVGPTHKVGTLEFPPQDVAAGLALGDRAAFNPWNALQAHEPLGSLNAVRRHSYGEAISLHGGDPVFPPA